MADRQSAEVWTALFVYGTLKRGLTNYDRYLAVAEANGKAAFVGEGTLTVRLPMVLRPKDMPPTTQAPILMDKEGTGHHIPGEVFEVDRSTLEAMDILERVGLPNGYVRRAMDVRLKGGEERIVSCMTYLFPPTPELLALEPLPAYCAEQHAVYRPSGPPQEAILSLCKQPAVHGLATPLPAPMEALCVRLLPGEDLLGALRAFAAERRLAAAFVLGCAGSTARTTLRPAGLPQPKVFEGRFEIVSLSGTLSCSGHHLHMSISDSECNVFGGHVLEGCEVRTTAEIVLGVLGGVRFTRPLDKRTGYDELSIALRPNCKRRREE
mmetsp:Transcript_15813/g.45079  ORF Transcript_15813/g.45079 Transcript_15813/m.45079 type:complete len:323 (+) Transcript_15813:87-1055(+)